MRSVSLLILVLVTTFVSAQKILIVSTHVDSLNNAPNGTFLMEIAYPFQVFTDGGYEVDIVTANGGKAALYHNGKLPDDLSTIKNSEFFKHKTEHTLSPKQVEVMRYAGIYYPGGGGQFYDVVDNKVIASLAASIYEQGGVIGAAGHGPASLVHIKLSSGEYLVKGKKITCFPKAYSAKWLPFDWEVILKQHGAEVILPVTSVERDKGVELADETNRFVTGSYAENAEWVAKKMMELIEKRLKK